MIDILLDSTGDIALSNGDFVLGRSNEQHQELLLRATKGSYKESPDVGVNIESFINDSEELLEQAVNTEFIKDGMVVKVSAKYDEQTGQLSYDADYQN